MELTIAIMFGLVVGFSIAVNIVASIVDAACYKGDTKGLFSDFSTSSIRFTENVDRVSRFYKASEFRDE